MVLVQVERRFVNDGSCGGLSKSLQLDLSSSSLGPPKVEACFIRLTSEEIEIVLPHEIL